MAGREGGGGLKEGFKIFWPFFSLFPQPLFFLLFKATLDKWLPIEYFEWLNFLIVWIIPYSGRQVLIKLFRNTEVLDALFLCCASSSS